MKKIFTLIAAVFMAVSANAALETVASFTAASTNAVDGTDIAGTNCTVQLHAAEMKQNAVDGTKYGASLNTDTKYVQIDLNDALQAGDVVFFSYFVGSNPAADNTEGISVSNKKTGEEDYKELAKLYVQKADQKNIVSGAYIAAGGEKKFIIYKLASTTMFYAVNVVRGYGSSIDFTNPALSTKEVAEANIMDAVNLTIDDSKDGDSDVTLWKNTAGGTATSFSFITAPLSFSYKNNSAGKNPLKGRVTGIQFNSKDVYLKITCNVGAKIIITPGSYAKDNIGGKYELTGATVDGASAETATTLTIPASSTDPVTLTATAAGVTLKVVNAGIFAKVEIKNPTTGIETLKSAKAIQNGATYNVAGQQVSAAYKGLVIKDGKKFVNK